MARTADPAMRSALIDEAAALLATGGASALTARRLATAVNASTSAVYTHFGGMDGLVRAVVTEGFHRLHHDLMTVTDTDDPLADLAGIGRAYRSMALANPNLYRVMFDVNPLDFRDPADRTKAEDCDLDPEADLTIALDAFNDLVTAVQRCVDASLVIGAATDLATTLWAAAHGAVTLELAGLLGDRGQATFDAATGAVVVAALS
jgi:AcrR family transcriptional regulator